MTNEVVDFLKYKIRYIHVCIILQFYLEIALQYFLFLFNQHNH